MYKNYHVPCAVTQNHVLCQVVLDSSTCISFSMSQNIQHYSTDTKGRVTYNSYICFMLDMPVNILGKDNYNTIFKN